MSDRPASPLQRWPSRIQGHALFLIQTPGNYRWACRCGAVITRHPSRAHARDVYRFHLLDVWMASWDPDYRSNKARP